MRIRPHILTAGAFGSLALNGMSFAFVGTSLPTLRVFLSINVELATGLMAIFQAGFTLFTLAGGLLSDLVPRQRVLFLGSVLLAVGALLLGSWSAYGINLLIFLCMGMGAGLILSGSNALLVGLYPEYRGLILNVHHVFFGLGSLIGPLIMGQLLSMGAWLRGYQGLAAASAVMAVLFLLASNSPKLAPRKQRFVSQVRGLFAAPIFLVLAGVSALAVGVQLALMLLAVLFLTEAKGLPIGMASLALSAFFVLLVVGRLIFGRLSMQVGNAKIILFLLSLQGLTLFLTWRTTGVASLVFVALNGLACSAIYPGLLALTSMLFKAVEGSALGILSTLAGLGSILICWLNGYVAQRTSLDAGFFILVAVSCGALTLFGLNFRRVLQRERLVSSTAHPARPQIR